MQLHHSCTEILPASGYLPVCEPFKIPMCLGGRVPVSCSQAPRVRTFLRRGLKRIVCSHNLGINGFQKRAVDKPPMSVDCTAPLLLGTWDGEGIWGTWWWRGSEQR